jgi:raffinose/stachyose/melibiose transport system substrate-binding protein
MKFGRTRRGPWAALVAVAASSVMALTACSAGGLRDDGDESGTLTFMIDNTGDNVKMAEQVAKDFMAANKDIKVKVETRPAGTEGDNLIKTRLSTGDMPDVFYYNSGSLFQALNPEKNLTPLGGESWAANLDEAFRPVVTANNQLYGAPMGSSFGGGVFYHRPTYERLGLQVPKTWAEFMANNAKIKAAGIDPVIQTFQTTWTSQLFVLGDFHNVAAAEPDFADRYTKNQVKYATSPNALKGFQHQKEIFDAGYLNKDFASATFEDGLRKVASGQGAHYPMLCSAISSMITAEPSAKTNVGCFAIPGDDAAKNGLTVWLPNALYVPKTTTGAKLDAAKKLLAFVVSPAGCESQAKAIAPTGPYPVKGCTLPADVPQAAKDTTVYFDSNAVTPALEFVSPVKGPSLEQITVEVGSGIRSPQDGAARYDEDVKKQAQQLGLPGW